MATPRVHLLIIDPQNDFCDLPERYRPEDVARPAPARLVPALPVAGAHQDMLRLTSFIQQLGSRIAALTVTLDTHLRLDIAHPGFWTREDGGPVAPFTTVSVEDLSSGRLLPRMLDARPRVQRYLEVLEAAGSYRHMIWPVHCEIGTWGHAVHADLQAACANWEELTLRPVDWIHKGLNPWTEHFSAIQAEVPDPGDPATQTNQALLERLDQADLVMIAGEAGSHCVKATVEHIVDRLAPERRRRIILFSDAMSPVPGFEAQQSAFLETMAGQGLRIAPIRALSEELTHA